MRTLKNISLLFIVFFILAGCAVQIPEEDIVAAESQAKPQPSTSEYEDALARMALIVNNGMAATNYIQVKPIGNQAGGKELPCDITEIVLTGLNGLSGMLLNVLPHYTPYTIGELETQSASKLRREELPKLNPLEADLLLSGAITEFDKDIKKFKDEWDVDIYIPGSYNGEEVDTDLLAQFVKSDSISCITLDLRLLDYASQVLLPQMQVSNTILVFELERERNLGFFIYGSGISRMGTVKYSQGFHQAIRNLVNYSILQLMGKYYHIPYWKALDLKEEEVMESPEYIARWRRDFLIKPLEEKTASLQNWLMKYDLGLINVDGAARSFIPVEEFGMFSRTTQAFALKFLYDYESESPLMQALERNDFLQYASADTLGDLYIMLVRNIPMEKKF